MAVMALLFGRKHEAVLHKVVDACKKHAAYYTALGYGRPLARDPEMVFWGLGEQENSANLQQPVRKDKVLMPDSIRWLY